MLISSKIDNGINGSVFVPGDKSISHRSIIISAIANGKTTVKKILKSEDVINTIEAIKLLGVKIEEYNNDLIVHGNGLHSLSQPSKKIYLGNSGTSARLLIGLLSAQKFNSVLVGDGSLSNRPMARIINPLKEMGANIASTNCKLPIQIYGKKLNTIRYDMNVPSAQVKSGIILASLFTNGKSEIIEKQTTRNHTEIMLKNFKANININKKDNYNCIQIIGNKELVPQNINIPGDFSSASFLIVASLINKNSEVEIKNINLNPTRIGFLTAIKNMRGNILIKNKKEQNGEIVADIVSKSSNLIGCNLNKEMAELMIDEFPILSIAASFANSPSVFKGLEELKIKESNRLELIKTNLENCGIYCKINNNDLYINPTKKINNNSNTIKTKKDHRIAMAFAIMGTKIGFDLKIENAEYINTSFPGFAKLINSIGGKLFE